MKSVATRVTNFTFRLHAENDDHYVVFSDGDTDEQWAFLAASSFRVDMIRVLAQGLDAEQRSAAIQNLSGILVP